MPEIILPTIPGLRHVGNGIAESQQQMLQELREQHKVQLWSESGTPEECEASWRAFILAGTPDWIIYGPTE